MIESRLMECETKIAYQEETLRVLNEVVTRQQNEIDQLKMACRQLAERIARGNAEGAVKGSFADEVPPHY
ncbi:MAG: SlyX family protein [Pseudomonadota bacterium]